MANGDAASAAGYPLVASTEDVRESFDKHNQTRDFVALKTAAQTKSLGALGTGTSNVQADLEYLNGQTVLAQNGAASANAAAGAALAASANRVSRAGDTMSGDLFLPAASPASSGWTVCYINSDGRVSRGSSSRRYKKYIHDAPDLGDLFAAPLREYQMRVDGILPDDHKKHIGYIAEELVGTDLERFVVVINDEIESIDFIAMLMAQVSQLNARVEALEDGA